MNSPLADRCLLLHLPLELQLDIIDLDSEVYVIWPILSKQTATTTRFDDELKKQGTWLQRKTYNVFGKRSSKLACQECFNHGQRHGEFKSWYSHGILREFYHCVNDKIEGEFKCWYNNGRKEIHCHLINDKLEGNSISYHRNGKVRSTCLYKEGKREGDFKEWLDNGQLTKQCHYVEGKLHGDFGLWFRNGEAFELHSYFHGEEKEEYLQWSYCTQEIRVKKNTKNESSCILS